MWRDRQRHCTRNAVVCHFLTVAGCMRQAHRSQPAADWDQIAGKLGVTSTPRPIKPPQKIVESSVAPAEAPRQVSITPERGEESPNFFDEQFDLEEPFDLLEPAGSSAAAPLARTILEAVYAEGPEPIAVARRAKSVR